MSPSWAVGLLAAFGVALAVVPLLRRLARRAGWIDQPASHKAHAQPVPLLGGLGVFVAFIVGLLAAEGIAGMAGHGALLVSATLLLAIGLWDDRSPLSPIIKLSATIVAAVMLLSSASLPALSWPAATLSMLWLVGMSNAFNLLDHLDGVAAGVGAIAAIGFGLTALGSGDTVLASLAAAFAGACGGFLLYNLPPARIFLGDGGSLWMGFVLAASSLRVVPPAASGSVVVVVLVSGLIVPVTDTLLVTVSRLRQGQNPMTAPGTDHTAHRLVRAGAGSYGTLAILYSIAAAGVAVARWAGQASAAQAVAIGLLVGVAIVAAVVLSERGAGGE